MVQDDPDLVVQAKAAGLRTIYRQSGDETLSTPPDVFVQTRAEKNADFVYLTNELDPTPELLDWTRRAIEYANPRGIKLCIFNFATDRSASQWANCRTTALQAIAGGHAIGCHVYQRNNYPGSSFEFLQLKHELGGLWLTTEYAFYVDAYHGWRGVLSTPQYGAFLDNTMPQFQREGMPVLLFSGDTWPLSDEGKRSGFGVLDNAAMLDEIARVNAKYSWSMPVTQPPAVQPPAVLGDPLAATVNATLGLRVHPTPDVFSALLRILPYQATVTEYPSNIKEQGSNVFVYIHDADGKPGWVAQKFLTPVDAPVSWVVNLDVPFVSQIDGASAASNNDCGIASLLMLERYWFDQHGLSTPTIPSVDDLERRSPLAQPNPPHGLAFADIQLLATLTGFQTRYVQPLTPDKIAASLGAGVPVMILCDYAIFNPVSGSKIPHLCIVKGFNATEFLCNDPYKLGANYRILKTQLDAAMKNVPGNSMPYQGLVL